MNGNLNGASFVSTKAGDEYCGYCLADGVPVLSCRCEGGEEAALRCEGLVLETGRDYLIEFDYLKSMDVTARNWSVLTLAGTDCPEGGDFSILQGDYSVRGTLAVLCQGEHHVISNLFLPDERYVHFSLLVGADGGYTLFIGGRFVGGFRPKIPAGKNPKSIVLGAGEDTGEVSGWAFWKNFSLRDATGTACASACGKATGRAARVCWKSRAPQSELVFNGRALRGANLYTQGDWVYPGFMRESSLFGRTLADADQLGTFALRWVGNCYKNPDSGRIELQCHTDYGLEVNRVSGRSGAFTTYTRADFCPIAGAASYYFFEELPGVYYVDLAFQARQSRKASSYSWPL